MWAFRWSTLRATRHEATGARWCDIGAVHNTIYTFVMGQLLVHNVSATVRFAFIRSDIALIIPFIPRWAIGWKQTALNKV